MRSRIIKTFWINTGKEGKRKTEITNFDTIKATVVAANNAKLYINREDGFVGYGLKRDEYVCECSDIDDIIAFTRDGKNVSSLGFRIRHLSERIFSTLVFSRRMTNAWSTTCSTPMVSLAKPM